MLCRRIFRIFVPKIALIFTFAVYIVGGVGHLIVWPGWLKVQGWGGLCPFRFQPLSLTVSFSLPTLHGPVIAI